MGTANILHSLVMNLRSKSIIWPGDSEVIGRLEYVYGHIYAHAYLDNFCIRKNHFLCVRQRLSIASKRMPAD